MQELIQRLIQQAGLSETQAVKAIEVVKDYAKEKFPVFSGAIDRLFEKYAPKPEDDFLD
jgi:hypothetical protein